jgi:hypothetical protein
METERLLRRLAPTDLYEMEKTNSFWTHADACTILAAKAGVLRPANKEL